MIIKILPGEFLFSNNGTHVLNEKGIATRAEADTDCEIDAEHYNRVLTIVTSERLARGLDENGQPPILVETNE